MRQSAESLRERPELVGLLMEEARIKVIDDLALEEKRGQTTIIHAERTCIMLV